MTQSHTPSFLRRALLADASVSAATGLLMALGATFLDGLLGLPTALLQYAGLLPMAAFIAYIAIRKPIARPAVWLIIACNGLWVLESIWLLLSGMVTPTGWGQAFVLTQAACVTVLAELEYIGLRRQGMTAA
jgi:hypothetical protein